MTRVPPHTLDSNSAVYAVALAVLAAGLSIACLLFLAMGLLGSHGAGPNWSRPWYEGLGKSLATLAILCFIAVVSIASLRAAWRTGEHYIATAFTTLLAGLSAVFSIGALFFIGYVAVASVFLPEHPNRKLFALHDAACKSDKEGVKRALAAGVSPTARWTDISPGDGGDALAAYFKCYETGRPFDQELIEILLTAGSSLTSRPIGYGTPPLETVLTSAPQEDRIRAARYLVGKVK